jgi:hypothetical protein
VLTLGGVYGGVIAAFGGLIVARGFGLRIILAWTVLFLALGVPFLLAGFPFLLGGLLFVAMAVAPLLLDWRAAGPQRTFLGLDRLDGRRFREREGARETFLAPGRPNPADAVEPTARDWGLGLGLPIIAIIVGVLLGVLAFSIA